MALFGWLDPKMAALYTESADRDRQGREAGHLLVNDEGTTPPSPFDPAALTLQKSE
jgi:hypothetical protein